MLSGRVFFCESHLWGVAARPRGSAPTSSRAPSTSMGTVSDLGARPMHGSDEIETDRAVRARPVPETTARRSLSGWLLVRTQKAKDDFIEQWVARDVRTEEGGPGLRTRLSEYGCRASGRIASCANRLKGRNPWRRGAGRGHWSGHGPDDGWLGGGPWSGVDFACLVAK